MDSHAKNVEKADDKPTHALLGKEIASVFGVRDDETGRESIQWFVGLVGGVTPEGLFVLAYDDGDVRHVQVRDAAAPCKSTSQHFGSWTEPATRRAHCSAASYIDSHNVQLQFLSRDMQMQECLDAIRAHDEKLHLLDASSAQPARPPHSSLPSRSQSPMLRRYAARHEGELFRDCLSLHDTSSPPPHRSHRRS